MHQPDELDPAGTASLLPARVSSAQVAVAALALDALGVFAYAVVTPHGPNRDALQAIALGTLLGLLALLPWSMRLAERPRAGFLVGVTLSAGIVLAVCAHLDRGAGSPLAFLLAVPPMAGALALPDVGAAACGAAAALELGLVVLTTAHLDRFGGSALVEGAVLLAAVVVATAANRNRVRLEALQRSLLDQLDELADTDPLTGCLKEKVFVSRLEAEVERALRYDEPLSLLLADVDGFAGFNRLHGHGAGDAALVDLGAHLRHLVRASDVVARVGPDRFTVALVSTALHPSGTHGAAEVARRLSHTLAQSKGPGITVSIGLATLDLAEPTAPRLLEDATTALQRAKLAAPGGIALSPPSGLHLVPGAPRGATPSPRPPRARPWRAARRVPRPDRSVGGSEGS